METRGVDASETYYEVPHWMHLSFVNYDRENHPHKDEGQSTSGITNTSQLWLDSVEILANGMLRPRKDSRVILPSTQNSPNMKSKTLPSSFSALGNAAATPGKPASSTHERQLVSSRNFRDILEACRPRLTGFNMPSPLTSILLLHQLVSDKEKFSDSKSFVKRYVETKSVKLKEWGTVDFSELGARSLPRSSRGDGSSYQRMSSGDTGRSPENESGSAASSFASHMSNMLSKSYDRILWGQLDSPVSPRHSIQIQRSPSLEFANIQNLDSDTAVSGDSSSVDTENSSSRISVGKASLSGVESDFDADASRSAKRECRVADLRRVMAARDARFFAPSPTKFDVVGEIAMPRDLSNVTDAALASTPKSGGLLSQNL